jgi:protein-S-isoprenylcysteine O-methyltransferase Ste14
VARHNGTVAEKATLICWGVVFLTWIVEAVYYWARTPRGRREGTGSAALWQVGSVLVALLVYRLAWHDLHRVTEHSAWIELPGFLLLVASTAFTVWARIRLGRMWSASPNELQADHELRTDGPYAITRHPIYTGLLGMLLGTVLLNGLGGSLALLIVGGAFLAARIPIEERLMSKAFPDEYARYRRRVPRLVPGLHLVRRLH